jgi:putative hydrolase of the HAD superfamily
VPDVPAKLPTRQAPPAAVTFDCWSTLIQDVDGREAVRLRALALVDIAGRRGIHLDLDQAKGLIDEAWHEHVAVWRRGGLFGPEGAGRWLIDRLGITDGQDLADELAMAIESATRHVGVRMVEGAGEALELVRSRGIPTALVCDTGFTTGRSVRMALADHGLELDHLFFSDEVGTPKPHPPIFLAALEATGAEPDRAVHIGDLRRTDVAGARAVGMGTIRFAGVHNDTWTDEDTTGDEADAVLERWSDLGPLLGL